MTYRSANLESQSSAVRTVGAMLRSTRESLGLTVRDMADITRIQPAYLQCLEADRYHELPAEVFVRGFIRSYARELRLDEQGVMGDYLRQTGQHAVVPAQQVAEPAERRLTPSRFATSRRPGRVVYAAGVATLVTLFALAVLALGGGRGETDTAASNFRVSDAADAWLPSSSAGSDWSRR